MSAPASFRIEYRRQGSLLRAKLTGVKGSLEITLAYWRALAEEARRDPPRALLVVCDMEGDPAPPGQISELIQAMVGQGLENIRVAYVEARSQQIPAVEFAEILAREQGFDARVFGNEADATVWLRHGLS